MRRFLLLSTLCLLGVSTVALLARPAEANEVPFGTIVTADGGTAQYATSNLNTATPFRIPALSRITIQPNAAAYICVDDVRKYDAGSTLSDGGVGPWSQYVSPYCSSAVGVKVAADTAFPSSCQSAINLAMPDGGFSSCTVSAVPVTGTALTTAVWVRQINGAPAEF